MTYMFHTGCNTTQHCNTRNTHRTKLLTLFLNLFSFGELHSTALISPLTAVPAKVSVLKDIDADRIVPKFALVRKGFHSTTSWVFEVSLAFGCDTD